MDRWLNRLEDPDASVRLSAVQEARAQDQAEVEIRLRRVALNDPDASVRLAALESLITSPDEPTATTLRKALLDPVPAIRKLAVRALSDYPGEETARALASRVDDQFEIADAAFRSLSQIGDDWTLEQLSSLAGSQLLSRQLDAIAALGASRNPAAVPKLAVHLNSDEARVRAAAVEALANFGHTTEFTGAGAILVDTLVRSLEDPEPEVRLNGAKALRHVKAWETYVPLNAALGDEDARVREAALETLTRLGAPTHARMAVRALGQDSARLRTGALRRLESLSDRSTFYAIAASLHDDVDAVRRSAAASFRNLRCEPTLQHFHEALETEVPRLRAGAIRCLAEQRDYDSIPRVLECLGDPDFGVRLAAAKALGDLCADDACSVLCELLDDPEPALREAAIESLGKLGCRRALPALRERHKTFGGEPDGRLRKLLRAAIQAIEERTEQHAHLPLAAYPPEPEHNELPISTSAPSLPDGR
jgi:HEAT repeat protein